MALTNEQILEEIRVAMSDNSDTKKKINEALTHAQTAIQNMEKRLQAEYEQGLNDGWNAAKRVAIDELGGFSNDELQEIFNTSRIYNIYSEFSAKETLEKIKTYEEKKNKLTRGDEVVAELSVAEFTGIYLGESEGEYYWIIDPNNNSPRRLDKNMWTLTKTGRHVDIFRDEKGE